MKCLIFITWVLRLLVPPRDSKTFSDRLVVYLKDQRSITLRSMAKVLYDTFIQMLMHYTYKHVLVQKNNKMIWVNHAFNMYINMFCGQSNPTWYHIWDFIHFTRTGGQKYIFDVKFYLKCIIFGAPILTNCSSKSKCDTLKLIHFRSVNLVLLVLWQRMTNWS